MLRLLKQELFPLGQKHSYTVGVRHFPTGDFPSDNFPSLVAAFQMFNFPTGKFPKVMYSEAPQGAVGGPALW